MLKPQTIPVPLLGAALLFLMAISTGEVAPDFSLKNQDGKVITLNAQKGKPVLIYFYPKDETPGCTTEACTLRDEFKKFQKHGAVIFGVSTQGVESHKAFKTHHKLPFDLLVDTDGKMAKSYGVEEMAPGLLERKSILIGPNQKILKVYSSVNPSGHAAEVLKDLDAAKQAS
jgi:peroxiredoxin Q/BCP